MNSDFDNNSYGEDDYYDDDGYYDDNYYEDDAYSIASCYQYDDNSVASSPSHTSISSGPRKSNLWDPDSNEDYVRSISYPLLEENNFESKSYLSSNKKFNVDSKG